MAVRLSVVMIHSAPLGGREQRLAESVVGELIGTPGIDLTLVGPLRQISATSTDQLSLTSISGDLAVLDWQAPEPTLTDLARLGLGGSRAPHPADPEVPVPPPGSRRVYLFDLTRHDNAGEVIDGLRRVQSDRQVRTFSILPTPAGSPGVTSRSRPESPPEPVSRHTTSPTDQTAPRVAARHEVPGRGTRGGGADLDLDDLLDQLDRSDP